MCKKQYVNTGRASPRALISSPQEFVSLLKADDDPKFARKWKLFPHARSSCVGCTLPLNQKARASIEATITVSTC
jgi:hypothetical protein